ncbi:MAG: JDVT-CTERM system glutamic-type intramembrane protease [Caldimonas sp.]
MKRDVTTIPSSARLPATDVLGKKVVLFIVLAAAVAVPIALVAAAAGFGMSTRDPIRDLAVIALWSVTEEIIFRGGLQPWLARTLKRGGSRWITPANSLTSLLFAALHLWRHPVSVAVLVFPVSLVYGRARELSGRVWPAALLHLWFNGLLYGASWLHAGGSAS